MKISKNKLNKVAKITLIIGILFFPADIFAMKINEIMYDVSGTDTGREWIEIYNDTSADVDFSGWKILESAVNHTVKLILGNSIIPAGGYAIIADNDQNFLADNPTFSGILFDSVFSLTNTGETLALINSSGTKINEINYTDSLGAKGDGNSLQLHEGFLLSAIPTISAKNNTESSTPQKLESNATTSQNTSVITISSHSSPASIVEVKEVPGFEISIGRERLASIKTPVIFEAKTIEKYGLNRIKYLWNFGDGNQERNKKVEHYYKNEGLYNVVLNAVSGINHAVARTIVHVKKPNIALEIKENGIELNNLDINELNVGLWKLKSEDQNIEFTFPLDTIIGPNTKITFDKELFIEEGDLWNYENQSVNLFFPTGDLATKTSAIINE
ncbi:MAG: lamin tail domain-containing protein [Candidatus Pacebacteria bacterium]|nr:lamin tail domain-containing protein [Candidatus Paceibacterota bacterium]